MNTESMLSEISKLEREKAQLEVKEEQLNAEQADIALKLKEYGLTEQDLPNRIAELKKTLAAELSKLGIKVEGAPDKEPMEVFEGL